MVRAIRTGDRGLRAERRRRLRALGAGLVTAALGLGACGGGGSGTQSPTPTPTPSASESTGTPTPSPSPSPCASPTRAAAIYYAADVPGFGPRLYREFAKVGTCADPVTEAVAHMLQSPPTDPDYTSLWPTSTRVLSVSTSGTTATVDVSEFPALGAAFEGAAVQQLVWTATAADKSVRTVRLLVGGDVPDSGHADLSAPIARGNSLDTIANVWILAPLQGATVTSPVAVHVYGTGWEGHVPLVVTRGDEEVASTFVTTMMGGFAQARTAIDLPPGDYTISAYNDNGRDATLDLWDTKEFTVAD